MADRKFPISTAPFLKGETTTPGIMLHVLLTLLPVVALAFYFFGLSALLLLMSTSLGCLLTEWFFNKNTTKKYSVWDGSALLTGVLLALTLPPGFPLWMAFLGGVVAIGMGKLIWGGLGQNIFNPALLGRAFLQAAFPTAITTWSEPNGRYLALRGTNLAPPLYGAENIEGITSATPLSKMKFDQVPTALHDLLWGNTGGSLGETCGVILLVIGIYLVVRKVINWRIPASVLLTVVVLSGIIYLINPGQYPSPLFMVFSGGLLLGTVYMATDPVTSPLSAKGLWVFGIGIGVLVVLIRIWGGLPEGVMYAILLMNAFTPLINRYIKIRTFGHKK
ncbi:MAG: RnfABCDGE type electron transport complex subunit D [Cyclobacteriaceae bacterium]|nr:RnfABCDGE type electron transport complex subunit D [Cyclobacteriaceae bacterium]